MNKKFIIFITLTIIIFTSIKSNPSNSQSQYDDLRKNVETKLVIEYNLVKTLNQNKADITYYENILNLSLDTLKAAEKYHSTGDEQNANLNLELAIALLNNIDNDLKTIISEYYSNLFWINISKVIIPISVTVLIAIFTLVFWLFYKQYYYNKILRMKPEVNKA